MAHETHKRLRRSSAVSDNTTVQRHLFCSPSCYLQTCFHMHILALRKHSSAKFVSSLLEKNSNLGCILHRFRHLHCIVEKSLISHISHLMPAHAMIQTNLCMTITMQCMYIINITAVTELKKYYHSLAILNMQLVTYLLILQELIS